MCMYMRVCFSFQILFKGWFKGGEIGRCVEWCGSLLLTLDVAFLRLSCQFFFLFFRFFFAFFFSNFCIHERSITTEYVFYIHSSSSTLFHTSYVYISQPIWNSYNFLSNQQWTWLNWRRHLFVYVYVYVYFSLILLKKTLPCIHQLATFG